MQPGQPCQCLSCWPAVTEVPGGGLGVQTPGGWGGVKGTPRGGCGLKHHVGLIFPSMGLSQGFFQ